jgi:hypothetical protein
MVDDHHHCAGKPHTQQCSSCSEVELPTDRDAYTRTVVSEVAAVGVVRCRVVGSDRVIAADVNRWIHDWPAVIAMPTVVSVPSMMAVPIVVPMPSVMAVVPMMPVVAMVGRRLVRCSNA